MSKVFGSEKVEGKTPSGGEYFIAHFLDERGNPTYRDEATQIIIQEYDENDRMILETIGFTNKDS